MSDKLSDVLFLGALVCLALAPIAAIKLFRFIVRSRGLNELVEEGCAVRENGLEIFGYAGLGRKLIPFEQIESVELLSSPKALGRLCLLAISSRHFFRRVSGVVHVRLRAPERKLELFFANLFLTPQNPAALAKELNSKISGSLRMK